MSIHKRGQLEMIGLAIVVILLTLGLLFVLKFIVLKKPSTLRQEVTESQMASNLIGSMLKTTTHCKEMTIGELIQDCGNWYDVEAKQVVCDKDIQGNVLTSGQRISCKFLNETLEVILAGTIQKQRRNFDFRIFRNKDEYGWITRYNQSACNGPKESKRYPLPLEAGTVWVKFDICR